MKKLVLSIIAISALSISKAQPIGKAGEITKVTQDKHILPFTTGYVEYLPSDYDGVKKVPLVICFAGTGEGGDGSVSALDRPINQGPLSRVKNSKVTYPAVFICPQNNDKNYFSTDAMKAMYDDIISHYSIDLDRVYVVGFSAGGKNTWQFTDMYPELVAGIVPICGAGNVREPAPYLRTIPCWSFHNYADPTVTAGTTSDNFRYIAEKAGTKGVYSLNPTRGGADQSLWHYPHGGTFPNLTAAADDYTMQMVLTIKGADTTVSIGVEKGILEPKQFHAFTMYKTGGHDAWNKTFANNAMWTWLFKQNRKSLVTSTNTNLESVTVDVYPNPASNKVQVLLPTNVINEVVAIELYNNKGLVVDTYTKDFTPTFDINVSNHPKGAYLLKIRTANDSISKKIIVE